MVMFHTHHHQSFIAHAHDVLTVIVVTDGEVLIEIDEVNHEVKVRTARCYRRSPDPRGAAHSRLRLENAQPTSSSACAFRGSEG
jgi:hypothetical protein